LINSPHPKIAEKRLLRKDLWPPCCVLYIQRVSSSRARCRGARVFIYNEYISIYLLMTCSPLTEGGFLPDAVHNNTTPMPLIEPETANPDGPFNLLLALAEWAVVDLNGVPAGSTFILYKQPPAPFPGEI
jgi:hypothetical protein